MTAIHWLLRPSRAMPLDALPLLVTAGAAHLVQIEPVKQRG